ncbi:unnamed protein product [Brassicogethes aeneus]|uniref:DUF4746 domain-containing protein n=1 Tax=Brassicogethes aeneus TaxID=1431903 RepID=A0A9P0FKN2_BRAAE|nr:unnamed protein product [Brassicogethes aeneus]
MVYGNMREPPGSERSASQKLLVKSANEEEEPLMGIWAPPDSLTRGLALKILFPQMTAPFKLPEEIPVPPHLIFGYDAYKARDVIKLSEKYPGQVLALGFFTSDKPGEGELISKTLNDFETKPTPPTYDEKLVIQLSKTDYECLLEFLELNPSHKSKDAVEGEEEAKIFFPLGYNIPVKIKEEIKKKARKKGKKASAVAENTNGEAQPPPEGEAPPEALDAEKAPEDDTLIGEEGDVEEHDSGEEEDEDQEDGNAQNEEIDGETVEGADKATSPLPDVISEN